MSLLDWCLWPFVGQERRSHMLNYIYAALSSFRGIFSRNRTFLVFSMVVLGFLGTPEMIGITSLCRFWGLGQSMYNSFDQFFHSNAWSLHALICQWSAFVLSQKLTVMVQGRAVLLGDHTYVPKDGRTGCQVWLPCTSTPIAC